ESTFWANQSVSMNINPPFAISLIFLICAVYLFLIIKKNTKLFFPFILVSSLLIGLKVYAGIVLLGSLGLFAVIKLIIEKDWFYFKLFLPTLVISFLIFLIQTSMAVSL